MDSLDDNKSWTYGRLPEYMWIALILHRYGRKEGFRRLGLILKTLKDKTSLVHLRISDFLHSSEAEKESIFSVLLDNIEKDCLAPLTVVVSGEVDSKFALLFSNSMLIEERVQLITNCMKNIMDHQSHEATDIRYIVLIYSIICGKIRFLKEQGELLFKYQFVFLYLIIYIKCLIGRCFRMNR